MYEVLRNIDIVVFLRRVLDFNTCSYKFDLNHDIIRFTKAALIENKDIYSDKVVFWLSRPCGTLSMMLRDAYIKEEGYTSATHYKGQDGIMAFLIYAKYIKDGRVFGDVARVEYDDFCRYLENNCVNISEMELTFSDGSVEKYPYKEWNSNRELYQGNKAVKVFKGLLSPEKEIQLKSNMDTKIQELFFECNKSSSGPSLRDKSWFEVSIQENNEDERESLSFSLLADSTVYGTDSHKIIDAIKMITAEFCLTEKGKAILENQGTFTYRDFNEYVTNEFLEKYGLQRGYKQVIHINVANDSII